jgi:hypothetical protein
MPSVGWIPGCQECQVVDAGEDGYLTISLYDDPSGAEQSRQNASG